MKLEFNILKINKGNKLFKQVSQYNKNNEFIVVGEEKIDGKEYLKIIQLIKAEEGATALKLIGGLKLDQTAYSVEKTELKITDDFIEYEIQKKYLTMGLIEKIQKLNE